MRRVFVDTSGFYALIVGKDENHGRAEELFTLVQREAWRLVTTKAVVFEAHALLLHRSAWPLHSPEISGRGSK